MESDEECTYTNDLTNRERTQLINLYEKEDKMDKEIKALWDNVIKPYLDNIYSKQILDKLTDMDYDKFYYFMLTNSPVCMEIMEEKAYFQ